MSASSVSRGCALAVACCAIGGCGGGSSTTTTTHATAATTTTADDAIPTLTTDGGQGPDVPAPSTQGPTATRAAGAVLARPPVVVAERAGDSGWSYDVYFRTRRALPRQPDGGAAAIVRLDGAGGSSGPEHEPGARHCYVQYSITTAENERVGALRHPRAGARVVVRLRTTRQPKLRVQTAVPLVVITRSVSAAQAARRTGCAA